MVCGTHDPRHVSFRSCHCPFETRRRLLDAGIAVPGPGMSIMPWVEEPTLRMDEAGALESRYSYPEAPDFFDIERWWNTPLRRKTRNASQ